MKKNDKLAVNVITPTTKAESHDVPISPKEIVQQGLMSQADWDKVRPRGVSWKGAKRHGGTLLQSRG